MFRDDYIEMLNNPEINNYMHYVQFITDICIVKLPLYAYILHIYKGRLDILKYSMIDSIGI